MPLSRVVLRALVACAVLLPVACSSATGVPDGTRRSDAHYYANMALNATVLHISGS